MHRMENCLTSMPPRHNKKRWRKIFMLILMLTSCVFSGVNNKKNKSYFGFACACAFGQYSCVVGVFTAVILMLVKTGLTCSKMFFSVFLLFCVFP